MNERNSITVAGHAYNTTCKGTALPFPDSEIQWKSDPSFENISPATSKLPYIDILQQIFIDHVLSGRHHFGGYWYYDL